MQISTQLSFSSPEMFASVKAQTGGGFGKFLHHQSLKIFRSVSLQPLCAFSPSSSANISVTFVVLKTFEVLVDGSPHASDLTEAGRYRDAAHKHSFAHRASVRSSPDLVMHRSWGRSDSVNQRCRNIFLQSLCERGLRYSSYGVFQ